MSGQGISHLQSFKWTVPVNLHISNLAAEFHRLSFVQVVGLTIGYDSACFAFASLCPFVIIWGGAALLNLSLLAGDLWAALARILFFGKFHT